VDPLLTEKARTRSINQNSQGGKKINERGLGKGKGESWLNYYYGRGKKLKGDEGAAERRVDENETTFFSIPTSSLANRITEPPWDHMKKEREVKTLK